MFKFIIIVIFSVCVTGLVADTVKVDDIPLLNTTAKASVEKFQKATMTCNNFIAKGHKRAYRVLTGLENSLSDIEAGKNFVYCFMYRMKWIKKTGELDKSTIVSDLLNLIKPKHRTKAYWLGTKVIAIRCLQNFHDAGDDFSNPFGIAICLYDDGLVELTTEAMEVASAYFI